MGMRKVNKMFLRKERAAAKIRRDKNKLKRITKLAIKAQAAK